MQVTTNYRGGLKKECDIPRRNWTESRARGGVSFIIGFKLFFCDKWGLQNKNIKIGKLQNPFEATKKKCLRYRVWT